MTDPKEQTEHLNAPLRSTVVVERRRPHAAWWLIGISLAIIAACMLAERLDRSSSRAFAQGTRTAGAHGIFAFTGQMSKDAYGVFMVDVDAGTLWCYRFLAGTKNVLQLVAARDWRYDRYLSNFSTEPPTDFIQLQLEQQRAAALRNSRP